MRIGTTKVGIHAGLLVIRSNQLRFLVSKQFTFDRSCKDFAVSQALLGETQHKKLCFPTGSVRSRQCHKNKREAGASGLSIPKRSLGTSDVARFAVS
jgi:hypothetical protein